MISSLKEKVKESSLSRFYYYNGKKKYCSMFGMLQKDFQRLCRLEKTLYNTFHYWAKKLKEIARASISNNIRNPNILKQKNRTKAEIADANRRKNEEIEKFMRKYKESSITS
jgi:hypothetical protein